jgi:polyisoprenoid-binding protein YceI
MATATQPFSQSFSTDPIHSSFGFGVKYQGASKYRGTLEDVTATLTPTGDGLVLEGEAKVESISIRTPEQFRQHVLSEDFFDVANHPVVTFRSSDVELAEDGTATVRGELTIRGVTREVVATGTWTAPFEDAFGNKRAGLELEAGIDRTDFGITWNMPLPNGGNVLDEQVALTVNLQLVGA